MFILGEELRDKSICFRSDNETVCHILSSMTSRSDRVMVLLRIITLRCMKLNIALRCQHISGIFNSICDALFLFDQEKFRSLAPEAAEEPCVISDQSYFPISR